MYPPGRTWTAQHLSWLNQIRLEHPSEHSSGTTRAQGPITKAGNGHARRLLAEAAWHHKRTYGLHAANVALTQTQNGDAR